MGLKISEYVNAHVLPIDTDLYDVSADIGGGSFQSRSIAWSVIKSNVANLYKENGTLAGNRIVSMGANELTFASTIDANLLKLETTFGRIGIGTATPTAKIEVVGTSFLNGSVGINTAPLTTGLIVQALSAGVQALSVKLNTGVEMFRVGLATATFTLDGNNSFDVTGASIFRGSSVGINPFTVNNSGGTQLIQANSSGNIMIGVGFATSKLQVEGTCKFNGSVNINSVATGLDLFMVKGSNTSSAFSTMKLVNSAGTSLMRVLNNGNIGIGTDSAASKLEVVGNTDSMTYSVNGTAGANFSGSVTSITVVDGLITAAA